METAYNLTSAPTYRCLEETSHALEKQSETFMMDLAGGPVVKTLSYQ